MTNIDDAFLGLDGEHLEVTLKDGSSVGGTARVDATAPNPLHIETSLGLISISLGRIRILKVYDRDEERLPEIKVDDNPFFRK